MQPLVAASREPGTQLEHTATPTERPVGITDEMNLLAIAAHGGATGLRLTILIVQDDGGDLVVPRQVAE